MKDEELLLVADEESKSQEVFPNETEYQEFCERFEAQVKPDLDKFREARRLSEEQAKKHFVF